MMVLDPQFALHASAMRLVGDIAGLLDADASEVFGSLCDVPDNMLVLLSSPQGWTALAGFLAMELGAPVPDYRPTVH
jgi:hypothetical protein